MKLKYVLLFVLISVSFFYIDNVSAKTYHFDFEDNLCDDTNSFCLDQLGTVQYSNNYVTSGNKSVYLENLSNTTSPNGFYFDNTKINNRDSYLYLEFDFYRSANALTYSKLFSINRSGNGGSNDNLEIKSSGSCHGLTSSNCWYDGSINHAIVKVYNGTIYLTISDSNNTKSFTYTYTKDFEINSFNFGFLKTIINGNVTWDDSPFTGYIDNLIIKTSEKEIPDNINNYYNITSFYDSDSSTYIDDNYYILKDNLDSMMYDDIEEWASTSNNYSSSSLNTIKRNLLNGNYDSYIENYGPYYITYNANTYNSNKICFFRNYNDIYLQRSYFSDDGVYRFRIYLKDSYCISYEKSNIISEYEKNGILQDYTILYNETLLDNILYLNNTNYTIYYSDEKIIKGLLGNEVNTLKLKNSFNSGTNAYGMSKVVWNIDASTDSQAVDGNINFKIQYGANDFTNKNIPIFNSYKIYGMNSYESGWTDITNDERFYFNDFNYEYFTLEGTATETVLTSTLNIPSDMCVYEKIKVEFYFDNTNNFYMYVFDDLYNSEWQDLESYFKDYIYYEFPTNKKYAFISHANNISNSGKLYVPYNDIINPDSLFGAYIYNYNIRSITKELLAQEFYDYDYYYFYDFIFSFDNKEVLMLQRKTGTNEKVSFYVPSDYIVEFSNNENITLLTPEGYVDIDTGKIDNIYRDDNVGEVSSFWTTFRNSINYFIEPISEIFEKITVFFNSLPSEIQYTFYVAFIFIILYYLTKFIL